MALHVRLIILEGGRTLPTLPTEAPLSMVIEHVTVQIRQTLNQ
jgi:hypothetical protein